MRSTIHVFKFGGASVKDSTGIKNITEIIRTYAHHPLVIIVSASGKTTNNLEAVIQAFYSNSPELHDKVDIVKKYHFDIAGELFPEKHPVFDTLNNLFVELEWILEDGPVQDYDYTYDQVVSLGEMLSTQIVAAFLNDSGINTQWLDARDIIRTDSTYREAQIDWESTEENVQKKIVNDVLASNKLAITQGFIGSTTDNQTTTLGREGSDFSAAIISYCVNAVDMTIWKDVPGVLSADPRLFKHVQKLDQLSYREAIEMTYYGASVIHPKTIKPLQNKNIPLYVKSFINPGDEGTFIGPDVEEHYPPLVVVEKNQILLHISSKDFSFVVEHHMAYLFKLFAELRIFVNMMRNTAISFTVCVPNVPDRISRLLDILDENYIVKIEHDLELLTIRHYQEEVLRSITKGKIILLEERLRNTIQMITKDVPVMERI